MATCVLDSWALMAFFQDEPAAERVERLLEQAAAGRGKLLLSVINWGEIYYSILRTAGEAMVEQKAREITALPIEIVPVESDLALVRQAASYKAAKKMSYADCFAAALAKIKKAELITGDPEFKQVANEIKIGWLK
ncbi:MAG: type II toxin-antitoxin system VapC family toxin [Kiritimatiellae bacterium]|jgi:ribonuclease VapC|nr:type II toxin-antitoxin system VapC family toxin [Kiritimatiellia bacterium]